MMWSCTMGQIIFTGREKSIENNWTKYLTRYKIKSKTAE